MTSNALETQGFEFEIQTASTPSVVWAEVNEITNFSAFDGTASEIDVTHLKSTAKEFRMGLQDYGTFQMDVNYLPADDGQEAMRAAKATRELTNFRATFSDGTVATFSGFVGSAPISGGVDAKMDGSFTIRISGDVEFA